MYSRSRSPTRSSSSGPLAPAKYHVAPHNSPKLPKSKNTDSKP